MHKVLVVEDDIEIAEGIGKILTKEGWSYELCHTGGDALQMLKLTQFDVVLLDWELPDYSGQEIIRRYRRDGGRATVIFVTGQNSMDYMEVGLNDGADDYITKPFNPREIIARIKANKRRGRLLAEGLSVGALNLDVKGLALKTGDGTIVLTNTEAQILQVFFKHQSDVFSSSQLFNQVWSNDSEAQSDTVRVHMHILRRKLALKGLKELILTVPNAGYRLNPEFIE
ncbi:MAG TPA: response regulator transcription factor [Drouetiella sp.]